MLRESDEMWPLPWPRIEYMLKTYGGWSRMFKRSLKAVDSERVVARENEPGFWENYALALAEEQFREEVEIAYKEFVREYGRRGKSPKELKMLLANALLSEGWRPVKSRIWKKIVELRKEKREGIRALKNSIAKRRKYNGKEKRK